MPNMDGFEAAIEIRKIEAQRKADSLTREEGLFKRSKIFALTGLATAEDKRRAFTAGVDGYLVKPVSFKTLDIVFQNLTTT
ncbi:His Kinase A domain containing protein [Tulasnella sp. 418]|nr:His Kinase A domain containing protein [Tulasnella sp. 418]